MANLYLPLNFTVDIDKDTKQMTLEAPLVAGDNQAHRVTVTCLRGQSAADLSNASATCYVVLSNRQTVIVAAVVSANKITATLNSACYAVPGRVYILVRLSTGSQISTPLYLTGSVISGTTDTYIDPGDIVPSLEELLALIGEMQTQITAAKAATTAANTATANANAATAAANTAAQGANTAAGAANTAAANANAATAKWDTVLVDVDMLPPDGTPSGSVTQTPNSTTIHLDLPQGRITNATLYMDDAAMTVMQRVPNLPEIGIDWVVDEGTTMLYQRVHGY